MIFNKETSQSKLVTLQMKKLIIIIFLASSISLFSSSYLKKDISGSNAPTVEIKISLKNYNEKKVILAYLYGGKTYIKDSLTLKNGLFSYTSDEPIKGGIYKIVLAPDNTFFDILIDKNNHHFELHTDAKDLINQMVVLDSEDNKQFYDYLRFLNLKNKEGDIINAHIKENLKSNDDLEKLNREVIAYQDQIIKNHPLSLTTLLIKGNREIEIPEFTTISDESEKQQARYHYYKKNFFNLVDFSDERLVMTDFFKPKIDYYIEKLTYQETDSIKASVDFILNKAKNNPETYKFLVIEFLNKYATSKIVCMDAVYVHIGEKYYCNPVGFKKPDWIEAEQLKKICDNVNLLKPNLCGVKAPDVQVNLLPVSNPSKLNISSFKSKYKVLFFWDVSTSNYHEIFTKFDEIYPDLKSKGVEIIAISVGNEDESEVENFLLNYKAKWINAVEIENSASQKYNITVTPSIFLLDEQNTILYKRLSYDQIEGVLSDLIQ